MKNKASYAFTRVRIHNALYATLIAPNVEAELYELLAEEAVQNRARVLKWIVGKDEGYSDDA